MHELKEQVTLALLDKSNPQKAAFFLDSLQSNPAKGLLL
jgi:flagellar motor switch protein FliG